MTSTRVHRSTGRRSFRRAGIASAAALTMVLSACGGGGSGGGGGGGEEGIIVGTTDDVASIDPAECYSYFCGTIIDNVGSTLVSYKPGETTPSPDLTASEPKVSDDGRTYTFTLRKGVKFHNGSDLTSEDVKFSLNRARWIAHPDGASFLLGGIESIETPDPTTVVINLTEPDTTFGAKLAYNVATILPSDGPYKSPDGPLPEDAPQQRKDSFLLNEDLVSAGPYTLEEFKPGESIQLNKFADYFGESARNDRVLVNFFAESSQMQAALQSGDIDVAYRHLTPEQRQSLQNKQNIKVVEGKGASIRYMVFNISSKHPTISDVNVRKAVAATIDRQRLIENVLAGGAEPLYSMVPPLFEANVPAFKQAYGDKKASDFLDEPVSIDLWHESSGHYGDTETALAQEIGRMLEESDMFKVNVQNAEWAQYSDNNAPAATSPYPAYLLGWYPDFLDPDNYIQPFYHSKGYTQNYDNARMDKLIAEEQTASEPDSSQRMQTFKEIQQLAAEDVPIIPLYVQTPYAFARQSVQGLEQTMDASQVFRFYTLSKN